MVPADRITAASDCPPRPGDYVLYWMIAARRTTWSPALERALALAREHGKPLAVLEALRVDYPWASPRLHRFVVQGMADNARAFDAAGVRYHAYVEPEPGAGSGLLAALAERAVAVVTDAFPCFFLPAMVRAAAKQLRAAGVRLEVVDGNGVLPLQAAGRVFTTAASFRRHLQKTLPEHLDRFPLAAPLDGYDLGHATLPADALRRWPHAGALLAHPDRIRELPLSGPGPVADDGGSAAAARTLATFLDERLERYTERNHPDEHVASGLSPWLHFGHVSAHEVVWRVLDREGWDPGDLGPVTGSREGWWGLSAASEAFLDEIVTWRELGYVFCDQQPDYHRYATLPDWARETLSEHRKDPRPEVYDLQTLDAADTADPLWNAAQRQLREEGRIHNYLRMVWGKRVLGWAEAPEQAWDQLVELNNRYAVDGRNPNSYSGIAWVFGRFDRAWGPERPIFGKVRYMSSENTVKKLHLDDWLARWGDR
ncbi:MAG: deoxyribodipyrimidine photo-lyase [Myxococcota bacterium]